jgi:hypothetical protein
MGEFPFIMRLVKELKILFNCLFIKVPTLMPQIILILMIFDYWGPGEIPNEPSLANGRINLSEISGDYTGDYQEDMVFILDRHKKIDLAFNESGSVSRHICRYTIMKLPPEMMFPTHAIGTEYEYHLFAEESKKKISQKPI